MIRNLFKLVVFLIFVPQFASAQTSRLASNFALNFDPLSGRWEASIDAPERAFEVMMADMAHDNVALGIVQVGKETVTRVNPASRQLTQSSTTMSSGRIVTTDLTNNSGPLF